MPDIDAIDRYLQKRLQREGREEVSAVQAAAWLDEAGLLPDSGHRPGLPLRRLLRKERIRGQQQRPNLPYGRWWIRRVRLPPASR